MALRILGTIGAMGPKKILVVLWQCQSSRGCFVSPKGVQRSGPHTPKGVCGGNLMIFQDPPEQNKNHPNPSETTPNSPQNGANMCSKMVAFTARKMGYVGPHPMG